ncbi:uncharacterized protein LOC129975582 [Argiope bruennichi]|uniref:uncharacterized protein LOC129975582 n=1 Tax=Argiope bruennichi TaxID=94029 RepID=UPI0024942F8F|nr:uncharacterized protein LOC129975582 [Argiope bruennichi]
MVHLPDIILVQEPYINEGKITGIPSSWNQWISNNQKADLIALPSCRSPVFLHSTDNSTAIKMQMDKGPLTIISSYSSPHSNISETLQDLDVLLKSIGTEMALIGEDLNAHSKIWGYRDENARGFLVEDLIAANHLFLLNNRNSPPTFETNNGKGWPDLSIVKEAYLASICNWEVLEDYSLSDQKYIKIHISSQRKGSSYYRFKTAYGGHSKMIQQLSTKIQELLNSIASFQNHEVLSAASHLIYNLKSSRHAKQPTR